MAERNLPGLGLRGFWPEGTDHWGDENDVNIRVLSALVQCAVLETVAVVPGVPVDGDIYLMTNDAALNATEIAIRDEGAWVYFTPAEGWLLYDKTEDVYKTFDGTDWIEFVGNGVEEAPEDGTSYVRKDGAWVAETTGGGTAPTESLIIAVGDETTAITVGVAKVTFRMPYAFTLTGVRASLTTVSSSGNPTVDINEGGVTILSTKLSVDSGEKTSTTAATPAVISDTALADDAEITIDIDTAGTGAAGLKVYLIGHQ